MVLPRPRAAAALLALMVMPLSAGTPAHAALDACVADVSINSSASGEFVATVSATLTGSCAAVGFHDTITCDLYLVGALRVLRSAEATGTTDGGCAVSTSMSGLQKLPYVAVGVVTYRLADVLPLPGIDVAAAVP
jgi:hypothetical protein